jgi:hypothetical protein
MFVSKRTASRRLAGIEGTVRLITAPLVLVLDPLAALLTLAASRSPRADRNAFGYSCLSHFFFHSRILSSKT